MRERAIAVFSQLQGAGGVPRLARHTAAAFARAAREQGLEPVLLSLNDAGVVHVDVAEDLAVASGFGRGKLQLGARVLRESARARMIFLHHPNLAPLGTLARAAGRVPSVVTQGFGIDVWQPLSAARRRALQRADACILISEHVRDEAIRVQGVRPERARVVQPCVDPGLLPTSAPPPASQPRVLCVTRLDSTESYKGVEPLIRAMPLVARDVPDASLIIAGEGDDRPRLEGLAARHAPGVVTFLGRIGDEALRDAYASARAFALPSSKEGFGLVYLEAAAYARPSLAIAARAAPEAVLHEETGLVAPDAEPASLAPALVALLADPERARKLGEAGRLRVEREFTYPRFRARFAAALEGCW